MFVKCSKIVKELRILKSKDRHLKIWYLYENRLVWKYEIIDEMLKLKIVYRILENTFKWLWISVELVMSKGINNSYNCLKFTQIWESLSQESFLEKCGAQGERVGISFASTWILQCREPDELLEQTIWFPKLLVIIINHHDPSINVQCIWFFFQ